MAILSRKSLQSRSTLSMLSVSLTILLILASLLFLGFRTELAEGYDQLAEATLGHIEVSFHQRLSDARMTVGKWFQSADGQSLCGDPDTTFVQHMPFINSTRGVLENTGYYQSVCFILRDRESALYLATGVSFPLSPETALLSQAKAIDAKNQPFTWSAPKQYSQEETLWYLAIPIADYPINSNAFSGMTVLSIDLHQLQKSLLADQSSPDFQICILDREGTIICHTDASLIGSNRKGESWVDLILADEHRFSANIGSTRYEFQSSGLSQNGFAIAIASESAAHAGFLARAGNFTVIAIVLAALLQIGLILIVSRRIFDPFVSVVSRMKASNQLQGAEFMTESGNEVDFLQQYSNAVSRRIQQLTLNQNQDFIAKNLLLGSNQTAVMQMLLENHILLPGQPCFLTLATVESGTPDATMQDYDRLRQSVNLVLQNLFSQYGHCGCLEIGLRRSLFFLTPATDSSPETILAKAKDAAASASSAHVYFVVSDLFSAESMDILQTFQLLNGTVRSAILLHRPLVYPSREALADLPDGLGVQEAVRDRNQEAYQRAIRGYLDMLPCLAWDGLLPLLSDLGAFICKAGGVSFRSVPEESAALTSHEELLAWLDDLYLRTASRKTVSTGHGTAALMEETVDYIRNNPDDENLSVNMLASRLQITPAYFGKLFQEFTGQKTLDYILQVRMERAQMLLLTESRTDIADIAKQVGYHNSAYFTTAFKKYCGETPSAYRDRCLTEKAPTEE